MTTAPASRRFRLRKAPEHIDIIYLSKLHTSDRDRRRRYLFVAIDRRSRSVHLAVAPKRVAFAAEDDETEQSTIAVLREVAAAFPFRLTHVLTDNGSCFTPAFAKACKGVDAQYRHTKPCTPQINGMVERFNGRIGSEVLGINICSHRALEQLPRGFNQAYNVRRQRVLDGSTCSQVVAEHLTGKLKLANPAPHGCAGPCEATKARLIAEAAREVSEPNAFRLLSNPGNEQCFLPGLKSWPHSAPGHHRKRHPGIYQRRPARPAPFQANCDFDLAIDNAP